MRFPVPAYKDIWAIGDGEFHRAETLPFVDGVFIPDGSKGPITVDSAGHTFADCPETVNFAPFLVWAGGAIPVAGFRTTMDGIDYARNGHGLLLMHANLGVTFDLDAIRKANPGWKVQRFLAMVANLERVSENGRQCIRRLLGIGRWPGAIPSLADHRPATVHFQSRFRSTSGDRFLTLVSTDGNKDISCDLIAFGDPRLELIGKNDRQASPKSTAKGGQ